MVRSGGSRKSEVRSQRYCHFEPACRRQVQCLFERSRELFWVRSRSLELLFFYFIRRTCLLADRAHKHKCVGAPSLADASRRRAFGSRFFIVLPFDCIQGDNKKSSNTSARSVSTMPQSFALHSSSLSLSKCSKGEPSADKCCTKTPHQFFSYI